MEVQSLLRDIGHSSPEQFIKTWTNKTGLELFINRIKASTDIKKAEAFFLS